MRVLIFHGYLLRGTGSNVYNASLATALARLGHAVHLVCQDREAPDLGAGAEGSVTIHTPDIGGLLPVYVRDTYEGFEVKTFPELSEEELVRYIELNVEAVRGLVDQLGGIDAALANHLVMAPVILARAGLRYALKVHGSDLSYTILPHLERFRPYAEEAVASANGILVGSGHIAERLRQAVDDPDTNAKVRLGPPGVDTDLFSIVPPPERAARLGRLASDLRTSAAPALDGRGEGVGVAAAGRSAARTRGLSGGGDPDPHAARSSWDRDPQQAAAAVEWFAEGEGARVVFVGKLIVSKGIDLLLAAWPLVHREHPGARLLVVGFGALEPVLRDVWAAMEKGDLGPLRALAERGRGLEGAENGGLPILTAFLERVGKDDHSTAAREAAGSVRFAGRLEHGEVGELVPCCEALVFPSTFPEAFGMVAAEAASAGVLPVSAGHSGALEVSRELAGRLPERVAPLVTFPVDDRSVEAIAERLDGWLGLDPELRSEAAAALRDTVERLWSWEGVARGVLAASAGQLGELPVPAAV